jgi:hypothetical protein
MPTSGKYTCFIGWSASDNRSPNTSSTCSQFANSLARSFEGTPAINLFVGPEPFVMDNELPDSWSAPEIK